MFFYHFHGFRKRTHDNIGAIYEFAFGGCSGFDGQLILPDNAAIDSYAFYNCKEFDGLHIGNNVIAIGEHAFQNCTGFTGTLTIPGSVKRIADYAFQNCSGFTGALTIPSHVNHIGSFAFEGCSGFDEALTFQTSSCSIGAYAFANCYNLTGTLLLPADYVLGENAFLKAAAYTDGTTEYTGRLADSNPYQFFANYRDEDSSPQLIRVDTEYEYPATVSSDGYKYYSIYYIQPYNYYDACVYETVPYVPVTSITVTPDPIMLEAGDELQLTVVAGPEDATNKNLIFSYDAECFYVDWLGSIFAWAEGTGTVTIVDEDNQCAPKTMTVTVLPRSAAEEYEAFNEAYNKLMDLKHDRYVSEEAEAEMGRIVNEARNKAYNERGYTYKPDASPEEKAKIAEATNDLLEAIEKYADEDGNLREEYQRDVAGSSFLTYIIRFFKKLIALLTGMCF